MNKTLYLQEIPYCRDNCELFERIRDLPDAALLDSSYPHAWSGRFDILTANPIGAGMPEYPRIATESACRSFYSDLAKFHEDRYGGIQPAAADIPFCGGLLGYLGYESGKGLHKIASEGPREGLAPAVRLRSYDWCVVQDHLLQRAVLVAQPGVSATERQDLLRRLRAPTNRPRRPFTLGSPFSSSLTQEQYRQAFERIQQYIHAGDCYQVNLAQRFQAPCSGDPWTAYRALRAVAAAPYSAYLQLEDDAAVLCLSPEHFISLHGHHVQTSPIKGTRPRFSDTRADELAAEELRHSEKDRAENLMIVDLLRNDLGRNCVPGSIHVERLFELQSFPTVHHLVSTITGELADGVSALELLRDSFPGGSITGAPKRRAMEIIDELETHPRQVYCGSIVYISADGRMDSNIGIRTLLCRNGEVLCWGGGGIVADSQWQLEYQETYDKVGKFLQVLESFQQ